jgi:hypothetical protein
MCWHVLEESSIMIRKTSKAKKRERQPKPSAETVQRIRAQLSYSIDDFCLLHGISGNTTN